MPELSFHNSFDVCVYIEPFICRRGNHNHAHGDGNSGAIIGATVLSTAWRWLSMTWSLVTMYMLPQGLELMEM